MSKLVLQSYYCIDSIPWGPNCRISPYSVALWDTCMTSCNGASKAVRSSGLFTPLRSSARLRNMQSRLRYWLRHEPMKPCAKGDPVMKNDRLGTRYCIVLCTITELFPCTTPQFRAAETPRWDDPTPEPILTRHQGGICSRVDRLQE